MHALGGVCAGEARDAASVPKESIGHNGLSDLPVSAVSARIQVIITDGTFSQIHFLL